MKSEILEIFNSVQGVEVQDFDIAPDGSFKMHMVYKDDVINPGSSAVRLARLMIDMRTKYPDYIRTESLRAMEVSELPS
jgi:hypothetical protein